ncbi:hypothetical protein J2T60_001631 [Natronospira proteinivora]|uniref:Uncharacterized protein n=1 Tax=Natronospira proteinivora TaxID=1807133 RepID=A0ABT1G8I2_9GAMM|nr:hypothetical protein [Natronospira proteinivora]MCP1727631.1 hypothetical protein [Natronospira proteinivora]
MEVNAQAFSDTQAFHDAIDKAIDPAGGVRVSGLIDGQALPCSKVQALDVVHCPELTYLDLSRCPAGLHLLIIDCPKLQLVVLPDGGSGAVVHLDAGDGPGEMLFTGLLDGFDACWRGQTVALERPREALPLEGLRIEPAVPAEIEPDLSLLSEVEAAVVPCWSERLGAALPDNRLRQLVIADGRGLASELALCNRVDMESLQIEDAGSLTRLVANAPVSRLTLTGARQLAEVNARGRHLAIRGDGDLDKAGEALTIEGNWQQLLLEAMAVTSLSCRDADALEVAALPHLQNLDVHPLTQVSLGRDVGHFADLTGQTALRASALSECLDKALKGHAGAARLIQHWADSDGDWNRLKVLQLLAARLEAGGCSADMAWNLRCLLMVDNDLDPGEEDTELAGLDDRARVLKQAGNRWVWSFPSDQYREGWLADLSIYLHCRHLPAARRFEQLLANTLVPRHLATLAEWLMQHDEDPAGLRVILERSLVRLIRGHRQHGWSESSWSPSWNIPGVGRDSRWRGLPWQFRDSVSEDYRLLVQAAIRLGNGRMAEALARLGGWLPDHALALRMLRALASHGQDKARARLLRLAKTTPTLKDHERAEWIQAALRPPQSRLFSTEEQWQQALPV